MSSGVALTKATVPFFDDFVPPTCGDNVAKQGTVEIRLQGFPPSVLPEMKPHMQKLFRDVYNEITGTLILMCSFLPK